MDTTALSQAINTLATETETNAISPEYLANLLRKIADLLGTAHSDADASQTTQSLQKQIFETQDDLTQRIADTNQSLQKQISETQDGLTQRIAETANSLMPVVTIEQLDDLNTLAHASVKQGTGRQPATYFVVDRVAPNIVAGRCELFSDNMHHQITQVFTSHYQTDSKGNFSGHIDGEIFTYYRSYGLRDWGEGNTAKPPYHAWSQWQLADHNILSRLSALEKAPDNAPRAQTGSAGTTSDFIYSTGVFDQDLSLSNACVLTLGQTRIFQDEEGNLRFRRGFWTTEDTDKFITETIPLATTTAAGAMSPGDAALLRQSLHSSTANIGAATVTALRFAHGAVVDLGTVTNEQAETYAALSEVAGNPAIAWIVWRQSGSNTSGGTAGRILNVPTGYSGVTTQYLYRGDTVLARSIAGVTGQSGAATHPAEWVVTAPHRLSYDLNNQKLALRDFAGHSLGEVTIPMATDHLAGLMTPAYKAKLDSLDNLPRIGHFRGLLALVSLGAPSAALITSALRDVDLSRLGQYAALTDIESVSDGTKPTDYIPILSAAIISRNHSAGTKALRLLLSPPDHPLYLIVFALSDALAPLSLIEAKALL